ncbi:MAG: RidA family protein [Gammaproteobacteria bacterium]|nr:RidA family protein [Gammaproteobacteria bacterium]
MSNSIINPLHWPHPRGYSNGLLTEDGLLFVAGQIGWNAKQEIESDDLVVQIKHALQNVLAVVESAGGKASDIVRLTWYLIDKNSYIEQQRVIGEVYREVFGKHFPAMSVLIVQELVEDAALVEIEATAHIKK